MSSPLGSSSSRGPLDYHQMVHSALRNTAVGRNKFRMYMGSLDPHEENKILLLSKLGGIALAQDKENADSPSREGASFQSREVSQQVVEEVQEEIQNVINMIKNYGFNKTADPTFDILFHQICNEYQKIRVPIRKEEVEAAIILELEGVIQNLSGAMVVNPPWKGGVRMEPHYKTNLFGTRREVFIDYPKIPISEVYPTYRTFVHPLIANLLDSLNKREDVGTTKGLFRISPSSKLLEQLVDELSHGDMHQLREGVPDIHLLAVALKVVINRQFESSLISGELKQRLLHEWTETSSHAPEERIAALRDAMNQGDVDRSTRETLKSIICFCNGLKQFKDVTQMGASNLGIVLAPNMFELSDDPEAMMSEMQDMNQMLGFLIEHYQAIFE